MSTLLISHACFVNHDTGPGHPERPDRMRVVDKVLAHDTFKGLVRQDAPIRDDAEEYILKAHSADHLALVKAATKDVTTPRHIDGDTVVSAGSWEVAQRTVGAGLLAVDKVMDKSSGISNVFAQIRPPGHHAESNRVMGFCLFNSIAVAAHYARIKHGLERVAVIDFDVHHGNGTQDIFWSDPSLYYASTHQMPLYPGTGALNEHGVGNIWNAPLRPGDGGMEFREAVLRRIMPSLHNFAPDLILISAGFDAHEADPLGGLRLVESDYLWITEELAEMAQKHSGGRIVSMLEGGYDLTALAKSVAVHVHTLMDAGA